MARPPTVVGTRGDSPVVALAFSSDGGLAWARADGRLATWSRAERGGVHEVRPGPVAAFPTSIAFSNPLNRLYVGYTDGKVRAWATPDFARCEVGPHRDKSPVSLQLIEDRLLMSLTREGGPRIWEAASLTPAGTLAAPGGGGRSLSVGSGGEHVAIASDGEIWVYGGEHKLAGSMRWGRRITAIGCLRSEAAAILGDAEGNVRLWRAADAFQRTLLRTRWPVTALALEPDGHSVAVAYDTRVLLLPLATPYGSRPLGPWHTGRVTALAWSPAGDTLASASADGTVVLWAM